ncbi:Scs3p CYBJADRAFT_169627 [Cyberlindnera jadinii NRRL Y-1542]|uniref:FIT family protein scs3 n=1 Tax=Cyberlindnera jadinii (strain ATCC 18201 / CBS 1600 / BCRC 20928 / JCM 3617 / NBRC 0987 / NRRL Y-1542) TaxID=983966 RepID=A0A1E4RVC0_CYBJN|nr:hypothetical protein CYBJADRAFT_169627 [Cyberlindnera jadinii NRRL Y-1542]ODV71229.1 hypothetical protein CYBJADRAFT_169627 [Cyberlindnera jadinii NRRL Y-1542]
MEHVYGRHMKFAECYVTTAARSLRVTIPELVVIAVYPLTVLLGELLHHATGHVDSYFSNKHNLINVVFVKQGWAWTIFVLLYFLIQHYGLTRTTLLRILGGTAWWVVFTQWFFGLPLMDRIFLMTGGGCNYESFEIDIEQDVVIGSLMCRKMKGTWIGGHDPSGHVFLLVLSSLIMWFELLERGTLLTDLTKFRDAVQRSSVAPYGQITSCLRALTHSTMLLLGLLWLWWFMLLMTSTYYHYFSEKITGLIAAYIGLLIYIGPRFIHDTTRKVLKT